MKIKFSKKQICIYLSVALAIVILALATVFAVPFVVGASPSPVMVENPELLKEFAAPQVSIPTTDFSEKFNPNFWGKPGKDAPQIGTITEQAGPNDSVSIYGTGFEDATVYAYGLSQGKGVTKILSVTSQRDDFVNAIIDKDFDYSMYIIWIKGANGKKSAPVRVNAPKLSWISSNKASENAEIRIYGKFLTTENADGENAKSYVYLTNGDSYYEASVIEASPYRVTIKLPKGLKQGESYNIFVHNGHGGGYGWSNPLEIEYDSKAEDFWTGTTHTVTLTNGKATDTDIRKAILKALDGDTIYFPAGTYEIRNRILVNKSLRFVGEDKEKVKIVGVFTKNKSMNNSLAHGDVNSNPNHTAAFDVSAIPCEFSGFTFTDYVQGAENCADVTAPPNYDINYAHGTFIRARDDDDTGVAGQFRVHDCNFIINRCYSNITNCIYFSEATQQQNHEKYGKNHEFYATSNKGSSPIWTETDRAEITNCYFETPKEIISKGMHGGYIHGNTLVGTWVICGNSGSCAIFDNSSKNVDISNNRIYGMDERTDPDGHVVTGDKTFGRTIVMQSWAGPVDSHYIMNNVASRVGELNYNSGEHILFEEQTLMYVGKGTYNADGNTLRLDEMIADKWVWDTDTNTYKFRGFITDDFGVLQDAGADRSFAGQAVIIAKGTGIGQWRVITSASEDFTITLEKAWDIQPDQTSVFVVAPAFLEPVVYNNTIEGPKIYYKNYNSTNGVNAYATMLGTVIDRNNFSQMQVGVALNPHYNMKTYTFKDKTLTVDFNFNMFTQTLIMNNVITNTRYGVWNFPSIGVTKIDAEDEPIAHLQICTIMRNNKISDSRCLTGGADTHDTITITEENLSGVGIVVGRDYYEPPHILSTRYWLTDVILENNEFNNSKMAHVNVCFGQKNTVLRNNVFDGEKDVEYDDISYRNSHHNSGKYPEYPMFITE